MYDGVDLRVKIYFKEEGDACDFQTSLNAWEIHKQLANLKGVEIEPVTPAQITEPPDLERIRLQDYHPQASESPCQALDQLLLSYHLSVPVTEAADPSEPLVRYQSIDKVVPHIDHYKCHLKDKAKFHQMMDGLNTTEGIPLVALSIKEESENRNADNDNRYSVTLLLEFFYEELANVVAAKEGARRIDSSSWEMVVFVLDKAKFKECVAWKQKDTQKNGNSIELF